jgi:hypothetical protein
MTPKELKQIKGFPADYTLCGSIKEQFVQGAKLIEILGMGRIYTLFRKFFHHPNMLS